MRSNRWVLMAVGALALVLMGWAVRGRMLTLIGRPPMPRVPPIPVGSIRFAVIGDYGLGNASEAAVARLVDHWSPEFVATLGDNNYELAPGSIDRVVGRYYHEYIAPYRGRYGTGSAVNRFFPIPGHRDWDHDALQPYLDYFTLPGNERYYDLVWGPVHLFLLDTDEREPDGVADTSLQARWLQQRLAQSTARWKLVLAHHAPYTSHEVEDITRMRWPFKAWGADAVLSGFFHVYERLLVDGLPYFVNGAGGATISRFGAVDPRSQFRYVEDHGAMLVEASDTRITFRFVNRHGRIVDEYALVKPSS